MPFYEYECEGCGHRLEVLQQLSEAPLADCPSCHTPRLRRLVSAAGFRLKGSGWYVTDFKNKPAKSDAKGDAEPAAKADTKTDVKTGGESASKEAAAPAKAAPASE